MEPNFRYAGTSERAKTALGQTSLQGHLSTLETDFMVSTGSGFLALYASAGRFSHARAWAAPNPFCSRTGSACGL
tara:strand:- start:8581 stop:8805 length:225 start_codon:yes stop_codon:yes gene_type:complete